MTTGEKSYYASKGSRLIILFGIVFNFGYGLHYLFYINEILHYAIAGFILFYFIGFLFLFLFLKTRYVPIVKAGFGWIVIKQGNRNTGPFRSKGKVKNILIKKANVEYTRNGVFSLMISTLDKYRYFIYYLAKREREELVQKLINV